MATNRSTLFMWLENSVYTYTDVIIKKTSARITTGEEYRLYAVTSANANAADVAMPVGPFIPVGKAKSRAAAGALAGKLKRWIGEYYNDVI